MRCEQEYKWWRYGTTQVYRCGAHAVKGKDKDGKRRCFAHSPRMKKARLKAAQKRLANRVGEKNMKALVKKNKDAKQANKKLYGKRTCPRCRAKVGQRCQTRRSQMRYPWSYVHLERRFA